MTLPPKDFFELRETSPFVVRLILRRNAEEVNVLQALRLASRDQVRHYRNTRGQATVLKEAAACA